MSRRSWHILGAIFTFVLGSILHFTYALFGESRIAAVFSAVNESTFEHLKLLFWPFLIFTAVEYFIYGKEFSRFVYVRLLSVMFGMALIVIAFYSYSGVLGFNLLPIDIAVFLLGDAGAFYLSYELMKGATTLKRDKKLLGLFMWIILVAVISIWTFNPPALGIFIPPEI